MDSNSKVLGITIEQTPAHSINNQPSVGEYEA